MWLGERGANNTMDDAKRGMSQGIVVPACKTEKTRDGLAIRGGRLPGVNTEKKRAHRKTRNDSGSSD